MSDLCLALRYGDSVRSGPSGGHGCQLTGPARGFIIARGTTPMRHGKRNRNRDVTTTENYTVQYIKAGVHRSGQLSLAKRIEELRQACRCSVKKNRQQQGVSKLESLDRRLAFAVRYHPILPGVARGSPRGFRTGTYVPFVENRLLPLLRPLLFRRLKAVAAAAGPPY